MPKFPEGNPGRLVDPHDEKQTLDDRARSYLHGNCGSCHHPGGNAIVSFYLRRDLPFAKLNTNKGTGIGTFGIRSAKIIAPGDPYRSLLLYRMCKLGYGRMPYIGSGSVDSRGVALIEEWIRSLPHEDSDEDSTLVQTGSRDAEALAFLQRTHAGKRTTQMDQEPTKFLLESTSGALAVALGMHGDSIDRVDLGTAYLRTEGDLKGTGTFKQSEAMQKMPSDIRGLFDDFIPATMRRQTLGQYIDPNTILDLVGDAGRGKLIFFSDGARCKACHDPRDPSKSIGTTLVEINKKYKQPAEMLQHVLKPSLKIDEPFAAYAVNTTDGKVITGLLTEKTDELIVIKTAERKLIRVPTEEVDTMQKSPTSLMPDQILSDLTAQEAADLLAYIRSLGTVALP
jgi:putative heme-binding domain-containing protein